MNTFKQARTAEIEYHEQFYKQTELFVPGTWLSKPVQVVLDCLEKLLEENSQHGTAFRVLDLACGVGRNSIPIAKRIREQQGTVVGVDLIPSAIDKLLDNAEIYGVGGQIEGVVADVEYYSILPVSFDFIVSCSCLEHMSSEEAFRTVVGRMIEGTRAGGMNCILLSTEIMEVDQATGASLAGVIELNLRTDEAFGILQELYEDWDIQLESHLSQSIQEHKEGRNIEFKSNWLTFVARKKGTEFI
ncbi:class I SAM-dependent methyltransferase [Paenibacillus sp. SC116]|uniref:class I SAM-dependent methyltransferase n=1 Tax=Paenibacillus sp. SC116 TaxID=2968986 RepID=UPI00215A5A3A|nr:class I SAM-dependent methyltransferase [Paenibacillus sp. SC116]MCR8845873.1 class I SAM-dependent methyltransferase [Paenibacillus sp. SC116]